MATNRNRGGRGRRAALALAGIAAGVSVAEVWAEPVFETVTVHAATPRNRPNHRIPALLAAPNGDLLLFSEKRHDGPGDIGNHDMVFVRSGDRGRTWDPEQVLFDDGDAVCADITLCVDRERGRIFAFFLRDKKRFAYFSSDDSGRTWRGPVDIHEQVTRPGWDLVGLKDGAKAEVRGAQGTVAAAGSRSARWEHGWVQRYGCGPGAGGVQVTRGPHRGRLVVPARHRDYVNGGSGAMDTFSHVFFSDDHGVSWKAGPRVARHGNECRLVELADGNLMLSMRNANPADQVDNARRLVALSRDGGETWPVVYRDDALVSTAVHAGLRVYEAPAAGEWRGLVLFSNPASAVRQKEHPYGRYNLTVRWSRDDGRTWSAGRVIYPHPSSYSDLAVLDDGTIGIVYERGAKGGTSYWDELQFARFNLEWLFAPPHTLVE